MPDTLAPPANDALPLAIRSELRFLDGETTVKRQVRFRTLGCWPLTGAIASAATDVDGVIAELLDARSSERQGRLVDGALQASMERKKREGYF